MYLMCAGILLSPCRAQSPPASPHAEIYKSLARFELAPGPVVVQGLTLRRERAEMTFNGTFYFERPVAGHVRGAVFIGKGTFRAEPPPSAWERDNLKRMLNADAVESDFQTAVLRFSDSSFEELNRGARNDAPVPEDALKLAREFGPRVTKESGANLAARVVLSILNKEQPGFFIAQFDKGRRDRFTLLVDYQCRIPVAHFGINGGEKGIIYAYNKNILGNDVWLAFYSQADYDSRRVEYSDTFDLIEIPHMQMEVDLREPKKRMRLSARLTILPRLNGAVAVPLAINEGLGEGDNERQKKALRIKAAKSGNGGVLEVIQEEWDGGVLVLLPSPARQGETQLLELEFEGDSIYDTQVIPDCYYPLSDSWYPRHGYLNRSTFDITFRHHKRYAVASIGVRARDKAPADGGDKNDVVTQWKIDSPVALVTFGMGPFERHAEELDRKEGKLPVEFYSMPGGIMAIKEDFIVAELKNTVNYFNFLFGAYPYPRYGAMFYPFNVGRGFPTMLMIPPADRANKYTYSFVAHETAHQWWGNIVAWRSYRDQWLSEGFAEYSGLLYTSRRENPKAARDLLDSMRRSLLDPPATLTGIGSGRLVDIGPLILGARLATRESADAYVTLIYNKGALVLRMLHFMFSDPSTGKDDAFYQMLGDFVKKHENGWATSESFREVANQHIAATPIGKRYRIQDLNWFFQQWVFQSQLPSYRVEYEIEDGPDGTAVVKGFIYQDNAPENWVTILPLVMKMGKDQVAKGPVAAQGPKTPISIRLPARPQDVQLDPDLWILSEKTSAKKLR